jgi:hypothetical protein
MSDQVKSMANVIAKKSLRNGDSINDVYAELRELNVPDDIIKEAINHYLDEFNQDNKEDTLVDKNRNFEDWYFGPQDKKSSHWQKLVSILKSDKGWSDPMVDSLNHGSNAVVSKLANPKVDLQSNEVHSVRGLVLGYVQSGKTANYSAVISKAIDSGYKFIIVLAGIHNNLRLQTEKRLRAEIVNPSEFKADPVTKMDEDGDFNDKLASSANRVLGSKDGFGIAVLKKNSSVLRKFNRWLEEANDDVKTKTPVLIIDDESDQASVNTAKDPKKEQTAINGHIRKIIDKFKIVSYVGYTATPFANILIDSNIEDDLFPRDFITALKKPVSYIGAEELFGAMDTDGSYSSGLPLIRTIDTMDAAALKASKRKEDKVFDELPPSLEYAVDSFLVAGAIRISRGQSKEHISMLVHSSHLQKDQEQLHRLIEDHVLFRKNELRRQIEETEEMFKEIRDTEFKKTTKKLKVKADELSDADMFRNMKLFLETFQVILDNSSSDERLSFESKFWGIVVGGNTLSRGLTIEGLTTSYFLRASKMYDSLMQMGRWFGYRPGYLDLKRIFITEGLKRRFYEMASVENEVREEIRAMAESGDEKPIDLRVRIRQHPGMTVTARNKMKTAKAVSYSFSGRRVQPRYLSANDKVLKANRKAVESLIDSIESRHKVQSGFKNFRTSLLYKGISKDKILHFLDDYQISKANKRMTNPFIQKYLEGNEFIQEFNIAVMSQISEGNRFDFKNGESISLINRSYTSDYISDLDTDAIYIKGLAIPRDEMIDMADHLPHKPDNVDKVVEVGKERKSFSFLRRNYRPKDTPLLVIYPINNLSSSKDEKEEGNFTVKPIETSDIVFGVMFVFPEEENPIEGKYIVNSTV